MLKKSGMREEERGRENKRRQEEKGNVGDDHRSLATTELNYWKKRVEQLAKWANGKRGKENIGWKEGRKKKKESEPASSTWTFLPCKEHFTAEQQKPVTIFRTPSLGRERCGKGNQGAGWEVERDGHRWGQSGWERATPPFGRSLVPWFEPGPCSQPEPGAPPPSLPLPADDDGCRS